MSNAAPPDLHILHRFLRLSVFPFPYSNHFLQTVQFDLIERDSDHHHQLLDAVLPIQTALQTPEVEAFLLLVRDFFAALADVGEGIVPRGFLIGEVAHHDNGRVEAELVDLALKISKQLFLRFTAQNKEEQCEDQPRR